MTFNETNDDTTAENLSDEPTVAEETAHETVEAPPEIDPETGEIIASSADQPAADETAADETAADAAASDPEAAVAADGEQAETDSPEADAPEADAPEVVDAEDLVAEAPVVDSPADRPGKWFVVHTQSGYEKKVKQNLEARTQSMNMEGRIHEVVIPMEDVVEFKGGKKVVSQKKMFPGYLLVRCHLDDDSWYVIRNTPGVTGFVGQGTKPSPLRRKEVETFLTVKVEGEEAPTRKGRARLEYELHDTVRVKEGPFADFSGEIIELNEDQLKVKVLVNIFGRETPVELEFSQVAKL